MHKLLKFGVGALVALLLVGGGVLIHAQMQRDPDAEVALPAETLLPQAPPEAVADSDDVSVFVPELGLTLDVPGRAARLEPDWEWVVPEVPEGRLGFHFASFEPPMEPESLLPTPGLVLESEAVDLGWGQGRSYRLEVYASPAEEGQEPVVVSVQSHIVVRAEMEGDLYLVAGYASAPTFAELNRLEPLLQGMMESVTLD